MQFCRKEETADKSRKSNISEFVQKLQQQQQQQQPALRPEAAESIPDSFYSLDTLLSIEPDLCSLVAPEL